MNTDILLVTCVKTKRRQPAAAKDLYRSPPFKKQRGYAESLNVPWFILSAEYGLVAPDEWLAPYERYLPDTPKTYRTAWAAWVAARLELLMGDLSGKVVEIHASSAYLDVLRPQIELRGATIIDPLRGLPRHARQTWYRSASSVESVLEVAGETIGGGDDQAFVDALLDETTAIAPENFLAAGRSSANSPGLYSWWVDDEGADDISRGLGVRVEPGLIYAGLAGATRWPSGKRSDNTLWLRIATMHLGGNHEFSTFRRSLGSILASIAGSTRVDETALTRWMNLHLRVVVLAFEDRDELGRLETRVLPDSRPAFESEGHVEHTTSDAAQGTPRNGYYVVLNCTAHAV